MRRRKPPQMPSPPPPPSSGGPVTRQKPAELEPALVDRISALPDELLGEIILHLPTKDGTRTQALTSRWRHLWRSVPLNLDCCDLVADMDGVSPSLVSRVLSAHPGPGRGFCVRSDCSSHTVEAWLCSAALNNLEELDIGGLSWSGRRRLPTSIFRYSATLRVVNIRNRSLPDEAVQGLLFPQLKQLGLDRVYISEPSLHSLIAGCPALEFLLVLSCSGFRCLRINSLSLTSLCVRARIEESKSLAPFCFGEIVIEHAPCLERFIHLYTVWDRDVSIYSAPKLETLEFLTDWEDFGMKLVSASRVIPGLPVDNLTRAVHTVKSLSFNIYDLSLDKVVHLMILFPCLERLHLKSKVSEVKISWRRKHRNFIRCHDIRLKKLVLEPFLNTLSHVNFATFFVLNARVLEWMNFKIEAKLHNDEFLAEQHRKLQLENKASEGARFYFTTTSSQHAVWRARHPDDFGFSDPFLCRC